LVEITGKVAEGEELSNQQSTNDNQSELQAVIVDKGPNYGSINNK